MQDWLSFEELLLIAAETLGDPFDELEESVCVFRAQSSLAAPFARVCGADLHPDPVERAAICAARLICSRPFLRGNREVGYECMREMLVRSPFRWVRQMENAEDVADTLKSVETHEMTLTEFTAWVRERVVKA
jgi:prophage maintenance system killer protein